MHFRSAKTLISVTEKIIRAKIILRPFVIHIDLSVVTTKKFRSLT